MPKKVDKTQYKYGIQDLLYKQFGIDWYEKKEELAELIPCHIKTLNAYILIRKDDDAEIPTDVKLIMVNFFDLDGMDQLYSKPIEDKSEQSVKRKVA